MRYTMYGIILLAAFIVSGIAIEALADIGYHEIKEQALEIVNMHRSL